MIDLLLEKYIGNIRLDSYSKGDFDVFVNPSKRDIRDIEQQSFNNNGFRFIVDFKKKDVYAWSVGVIHRDIIRQFRKYWNSLDYQDYMSDAKGIDRYFTGHVESGNVQSDIWRGFEWRLQMGADPDFIDDLITMKNYDKSWLKKFDINPKDVQKLIDNVLIAAQTRIKELA